MIQNEAPMQQQVSRVEVEGCISSRGQCGQRLGAAQGPGGSTAPCVMAQLRDVAEGRRD